ncbi:uncharacterized protein LOC115620838 isoform X6 [Scaptodrosophila lebanonensis]|uniref:Uncharacterized protein LOC115620838 isoform X6 n=1 Tax=Drosophila lebanonensis TaxID=7225 RepID=A0A6J2T4H0_DROLE|nr:uncharacterized protein LOC115620838 isoform X6 [Scaptodrosophila lebanonensis]
MAAMPAATETQATPKTTIFTCDVELVNNNNSDVSALHPHPHPQLQQLPRTECDSDQIVNTGNSSINNRESAQSSPGKLNGSVDSGIAEEDTHAIKLRHQLQQCQRILEVLNRDQEAYQLLRDRLGKIVDKKTKKEQAVEEHNCNVCCAELDISNAKNYVTCSTCGKFVCRGLKCADWLPKNAKWECELCHSSKESMAQTSSWVAEQMSFNEHKFVYPMRARSEIYIPISDCNDSTMHFESVSQIGANSVAIMNLDDRTKIREYVEEIIAEMLGGSLEHIKVGQLSKSENYLPAIVNGQNATNNNNHNNNNNNNEQIGNASDFGDVSQTRLRSLIETIIAETLRTNALTTSGAVSEISLDARSNSQLPNGNGKRRHRTEHYFEPKIYQDLLATAVLNKIVDKEGNTKIISESTPDLSGHNIDENYNAEALSTTSGSSIEPRSDCSFTDNEHELVPHTELTDSHLERESVLSDYIASHMVPLPDLSASVTESEDDLHSMSSSMIGDGTWEDNWLFKKKRSTLQSSGTPSSIGMLVPAPKENVRAQIGDKTADEVSDLSEMGSDTDDFSLDLIRCNELNDRLLSKHLIGGQNTKLVLDEIVDRTSLTSNTLPAENEPAFTETSNPLLLDNKAFVTKTEDNTTAELTLPPPPPAYFQDDIESGETVPCPIAGSIAEREVKKWYNAVEMPNNPYAPEALKQRINGSQERCMDVPNISPSAEKTAIELLTNADPENIATHCAETDYKRYSRDYYINNANCSTSASTPRKGQAQAQALDEPPDDDIVINEALNANKTTTVQDTILDTSTTVFKAVPAQVLEEGASSIETSSNQSLQSVQTTTSDDSDTVRVYDFNKQETTVIKSGEQKPSELSEAPSGSATSSMESAHGASSSVDTPKKRERPIVLQFGPADSSPTLGSPITTPTRGSTPPAFRFLQPKRRLIEPSQVLSIDEDDVPEPCTPAEKPAIEKDVAHAMPSVKALAQAFLLTSKHTQPERRWRAKAKQVMLTPSPDTPTKPGSEPRRKPVLEHAISMAEVADESTIASDLSSLETDQSMQSEGQANPLPIASPASPVPVRRGFLRSNIAFFENLKFK